MQLQCIMNMEAATCISFELGLNFEWIIKQLLDLSLVRIMQLSRGLDLHINTSQNSESKRTANRRCETKYNFHSSRTKGAKKKCLRQELLPLIFDLSKWGCVFLLNFISRKEGCCCCCSFYHKNSKLNNQLVT